MAIESLDQPGNLYCLEPEVEDIRRQLLARNIAPKIALKSEMEVKSMSYNKTTITVLPAMWQQIEQWMQKLGMTYNGENLPFATFQVLCRLIKEQNSREQLSPEEKTGS